MKRRAFIIIAGLAIMLIGCKEEGPVAPVTHIAFDDLVEVDFERASINCTVTGNFSAEELTVEYALDQSLSGATKKTITGQSGVFQFSLEGLQIQSTYYYKYTAINKVNTLSDGKIRQFKTKDYVVPEVRTLDPENLDGRHATLKGVIDFACAKPVLEHGFYIGKSKEQLEKNPISGDDFTAVYDDLDYDSRYYFCAFASTEIGEGRGEVKEFQTRAAVDFAPVEVSKEGVSYFTVTGGIENAYGLKMNSRGFRYSPNGTEEVITMESPYDGSIRISGLNPGTEYEVWFFADTEDGLFESEHVAVKTLDYMPLLLPGVFSVSDTKKVSFSRSNIFYTKTTGESAFFQQQYTYLGMRSNKGDKWDYFYGASASKELEGIQWSALTNEEWEYLFTKREKASTHVYYNVEVEGVRGAILFPDGFIRYQTLLSDGMTMDWADYLDWQDRGMVFIPYAGDEIYTYVEKSEHEYSELEGVGTSAFMMTSGDMAVGIGTSGASFYVTTSRTSGQEYQTIKEYAGSIRYVKEIK